MAKVSGGAGRGAPGYNTSRQAVDNLYFVPDILIKK